MIFANLSVGIHLMKPIFSSVCIARFLRWRVTWAMAINGKSRINSFQPFLFRDFEKSLDVVEAIRTTAVNLGAESKSDIEDCVLLYELSSGLHGDFPVGYFLEIGTFHGMSASVITKGFLKFHSPNRFLFTIDKFSMYDAGGKAHKNDYIKIARQLFFKLGIEKHICQIVPDNSLSFLQFWNLPICLAYVDGGHHYEQVKAEIDMIMPFVVEGGWVIFHDYVEEDWSGVVPAVNEFIDASIPKSINVFGHETENKTSVIIHKVRRD